MGFLVYLTVVLEDKEVPESFYFESARNAEEAFVWALDFLVEKYGEFDFKDEEVVEYSGK
jgi:hypothetical protein